MNSSLFDLFPFVYKSTDARIHKSRSTDETGWDEVFEPTYTAIEHSTRLLSEWLVDTVSLVASIALCAFLWRRKRLMLKYANYISFATFSAQILYWPFYLLSTWQTMYLLFGKAPEYPSVLHCSLLRHFVLACFQSAGLITVPIAIDHICLVFLKKKLKVFNLVVIQVIITFVELFFTLGHLAIGDVTINDVCAQWIASPDVFLISMSFNNTLLIFAILANFTLVIVQVIDKFLFKSGIFWGFFFEISAEFSECTSTKHLSLNYSFVILLQSVTEFILSFPLTMRQWKVLLAGIRSVNYFCAYGYMFSFSCIFMVPLISMMCIPPIRRAFLDFFTCSGLKKPAIAIVDRRKFKFDNVYEK